MSEQSDERWCRVMLRRREEGPLYETQITWIEKVLATNDDVGRVALIQRMLAEGPGADYRM